MRTYFARHTRLSYKLGVFAPWRWLFDLHPVLLFFTLVAISPGVMLANDLLLVHGRIMPFNQMWLSAQFDIALALAAAVAVGMLRKVRIEQFPGILRARPLHYLCLLFGVGMSAVHMWQERASIPSLERRLGSNSLYHNLVLYPLLGYLLVLLCIAVVCVWYVGWRGLSVQYALGIALLTVLIGGWVSAGRYDRTHQYAPGGVHKSLIANPSDPWCGGLLTEPLCGPPQR